MTAVARALLEVDAIAASLVALMAEETEDGPETRGFRVTVMDMKFSWEGRILIGNPRRLLPKKVSRTSRNTARLLADADDIPCQVSSQPYVP
jgi:hypothetical protein